MTVLRTRLLAAAPLIFAIACSAPPAGSQGPKGEPGERGAAGAATLFSSEPLSAGSAECPGGGVRFVGGLDANGNGVLDEGETNQALTSVVCHGADGQARATVARATAIEAGAACATGGVRLELGVDANGNGALDEAEIDSSLTSEICHGASGLDGSKGEPGRTLLTRRSEVTDPATCALGGVRYEFGFDAGAFDGVLNDEEVDDALTSVLCQGERGLPGADGTNGIDGEKGDTGLVGLSLLASATVLDAGHAVCATGGVRLEFGPDADRDGLLSPTEIDPLLTSTVCHGLKGDTGATGPQGLQGPQGDAGLNAVSRVTALTAGEGGCATGGVRIEAGLDANRNGQLDAGEVDAALTSTVCHGLKGDTGAQGPQGEKGDTGATGVQGDAGLNAVARSTALLAGEGGCVTGGVLLEAGRDANRNGELDAGEVNAALTSILCHGLKGDTGPVGPAGPEGPMGPPGVNAVARTSSLSPGDADCPAGGVRLDFGQDSNGNGQLDAGEINAALSEIVCNGLQGERGAKGDKGEQGIPGIGSSDIYGDGGAGVLVISSNTNWSTNPPALLNASYLSITVNSGVTWTVPSGTVLRTTGQFTVNGTLVVLPGTPAPAGQPADPGLSAARADSPAGGLGLSAVGASSLLRPGVRVGGAGSPKGATPGGAGGGSLVVRAFGGITIASGGFIRANGGDAPAVSGQGPGSGGGSGGLIVLATRGSISVSGNIEALGGKGGHGLGSDYGGGGGGGGGIVHLMSSNAGSVAAARFNVAGGTYGNRSGTGDYAGGGGGALGGNGGPGDDRDQFFNAEAGATGLVLRSASSTPDALFY